MNMFYSAKNLMSRLNISLKILMLNIILLKAALEITWVILRLFSLKKISITLINSYYNI